MAAREAEQITDAEAFASIIKGAAAWPAWQRDALRRMALNGELTADDEEDLLAICKGEKPADPITADHVSDPKAANNTVALKRITGVEHVNALSPGQDLTFDKSGLTVIYGDNGAGKSGYTRILKKACRARAQREDILSNIFGKAGTPTATIDFTVGTHLMSTKWTQGTASDQQLSAVSVFDSRTASIHVDGTNELAYTPPPLQVLANLVATCTKLKNSLASEIDALTLQSPMALRTPPVGTETKVAKLIAALNGKTDPNTIEALATLDDKEEARYGTLKIDLAANPTALARIREDWINRLEVLLIDFEDIKSVSTDEVSQELREKYSAMLVAQEAARVASAATFADEPLPGVGSDVWRVLWDAARRYSTEVAYVEQPFPVLGDNARCVTCHQELGEDAKARMRRFEDFVTNDTKKAEDTAIKAFEEVRGEPLLTPPLLHEFWTPYNIVRDHLLDEPLAEEIRAAVLRLLWRHRHIVRHYSDTAEHPPMPTFPVVKVQAHIDAIQASIQALTADANSPERKALDAEFAELDARKWLGTVKADVLAEITRRATKAKLEKAQKDTNSTKITAMSTEVSAALVTNALRGRFAKEVARLGVANLAVELTQERSTKGVVRFKINLIHKPGTAVGSVLSEGEHRCVALAAFLAELATAEGKSAIVFDDPVSSLDHMHREKVAIRLVEESLERQVIVFTHDIAFLFLLSEAVRDQKAPNFALREVSRGRQYAGFANSNPPLKALPVDKVIDTIQARLKNEKIHYEQGKSEEWERTLRSLQESLRTTWERAVEDVVAPVVRRLGNKVSTSGLLKLTVITARDCETMREAFGRCSKLVHSDSDGLNKPLPKPEDVQAEIDALQTWVVDLRARQGKIK